MISSSIFFKSWALIVVLEALSTTLLPFAEFLFLVSLLFLFDFWGAGGLPFDSLFFLISEPSFCVLGDVSLTAFAGVEIPESGSYP